MDLSRARRIALPIVVTLGVFSAACGNDAARSGRTTARTSTTTTSATATQPPQRAAARTQPAEHVPARPAFVPCDDDDLKTALKIRPKTCRVLSGSNGIGPSTIAEGAAVAELRWRSWGRAKARATGVLGGQKTYDPDVPASIVFKSADCDDFIVYTHMTVTARDRPPFTIRLDADCDHLSATPPADDAAPEPDDQSSAEQDQLDEQQREIDAAKDRECARLYERWQSGRDVSGGSDEEGQRAIQEYGRLLCDQR